MDDLRPGFLCTSESDADRTIVTLSGELDAAGAPEFDRVFAAVLADGRDDVVVDLAGLGFIDSSGLRSFMLARSAVARRGGTLTFTEGGPEIRRLMAVTGLDTVFRFARGHEW